MLPPKSERMFKVGDKVIFGRQNGEQTHGTVVKVNSVKCKIRQDETRGTLRERPVGTIWTVPFSLIRLADGSTPTAALTPLPVQSAVTWKIGDKVSFNTRGQTFTGTVTKVNQKSVSVQTSTGMWRVGPSLLRKATGAEVATPPAARRPEAQIMADILATYSALSPEYLTCDGELPRHLVVKRRTALGQKLRALQMELGRLVSESAAYQWFENQRKSA